LVESTYGRRITHSLYPRLPMSCLGIVSKIGNEISATDDLNSQYLCPAEYKQSIITKRKSASEQGQQLPKPLTLFTSLKNFFVPREDSERTAFNKSGFYYVLLGSSNLPLGTPLDGQEECEDGAGLAPPPTMSIPRSI
jgi:hypothetical protein